MVAKGGMRVNGKGVCFALKLQRLAELGWLYFKAEATMLEQVRYLLIMKHLNSQKKPRNSQ